MHNLRKILPLYYDFYIVANEKSFSKAAEVNFTSQPSLSRNIQILEQELNLKLLNRSNKGIFLTKDGELLYKQLDAFFNQFIDFDTIHFNEMKGTLSIGSTRNIADNKLVSYLTAFTNKYPMVKIKIFTDSATNLNKFLMEHKIDVLIDYIPQINFKDVEVIHIGSFKTGFACSKAFYKRYGNKIKTLEDLKQYNLVLSGASRRRQWLDELLTPLDINFSPMIEMPDSKLMAEYVKQNEVIGYFVLEEIKDYDLCELKLDREMPLNHIGLIYHKDTIHPVARKFVELFENKN